MENVKCTNEENYEEQLWNIIIRYGVQVPTSLRLELMKVVYRPNTGNDSRYIRCYLRGSKGEQIDVTQLVAAITGLSVSRPYKAVIIHGSNMDMGFALQQKLKRQMDDAGYPCMADDYDFADVYGL